ncbi:exodeoxyribonuclease VII large subunit [Pontibacter sp. SGAir0037]|uniref:exodeoxyribonuclease VII large subunit n=1 Tax=Pontibacter sp. SGAir0037 TaxID=2571030 RepID=UPI0010CCB8A0|nr:exodeoxyribonuclease VII large subunit [Pontibacter sp. SGAir0037]QCR22781.1 exodeoxyribonuclease VII large subunit [Pontibacter sp. SGAir0037]
MSQFLFRQPSTDTDFQSPLSLFELHQQIREELELSFPESYWVIAEISQVSPDKRKGHCYLSLVDKGDDPRGQLQAQARATIWSARFQMVSRHFEEKTGQQLKAGLKILFQAKVRFHELYGMSLDILNIDPNYTIGDLARQRQETLKRLEAEGLLTANKELELTPVPQRLAIISSATAAGYQDFIHQLQHNAYGYTYSTTLFPATVQGNDAPASVKKAFTQVAHHAGRFDACILIRGGGSQTDLSCFDDYTIAAAISHSPIPVLTGIGHERDESIADLVAHTRLKTPTAVANFLVERLREAEEQVENMADSIYMLSSQLVRVNSDRLERKSLQVSNLTQNLLSVGKEKLEQLSRALLVKPKTYLDSQRNQVTIWEQTLRADTKDLLYEREKHLSELAVCVEGKSQRFLHLKEHELNHLVHCVETEAKDKLKQAQLQHARISEKMKYSAKEKLQNENHKIRLLDISIKANDPEKLLLRGYTLTLINGKIIKSIGQVKEGDVMETRMQNGTVHSIVVNKDEDDK